MPMKIEKLTDAMIRSLRAETSPDDDLALWHTCCVALGEEEPVTTPDAWEDRYGGGGHEERERVAVLRVDSREEARRLVAATIEIQRRERATALRSSPGFQAKYVGVRP